MGIKCEIKFVDNPLGIFYAGQKVAGKVDLSVDRATKITGEGYSYIFRCRIS